MTTFRERSPEQPRVARSSMQGKPTLAEILEILAGGRLPLYFTAYDGSSADCPTRRSGWS